MHGEYPQPRGINLTEKIEFFTRYDYISSVVISNDILKWNYLKDGSFAILGLQYTLSPYAKIALNYQGRYPYSSENVGTDMIFVNALFKF